MNVVHQLLQMRIPAYPVSLLPFLGLFLFFEAFSGALRFFLSSGGPVTSAASEAYENWLVLSLVRTCVISLLLSCHMVGY